MNQGKLTNDKKNKLKLGKLTYKLVVKIDE